jgi:hypothetical protein
MAKAGVGLSRLKYCCKACNIRPRGCDLSKHYEINTNWDLLQEMKACVGDLSLAEMKERADPHTLFMYEHKYNRKAMPTWQTHPMWRVEREEQLDDPDKEDPPPKKKSKGILGFFQKVTTDDAPLGNVIDTEDDTEENTDVNNSIHSEEESVDDMESESRANYCNPLLIRRGARVGV